MSDILQAIDRATAGVCPCGAQPRDGSAYCGPDCEPTHISDDTDQRDHGWLSTPMRWRPDLVSAGDDSDLIPLGSETHGYTGRFNAQVFERISAPETWHLRLDDGHRFVGVDVDNVGGRQEPISVEIVGRVREAWRRLERELENARHVVPDDDDPWPELIPPAVLAGLPVSRRRFGSDVPGWLRPDVSGSAIAQGDQVRVVHGDGRPDTVMVVAAVMVEGDEPTWLYELSDGRVVTPSSPGSRVLGAAPQTRGRPPRPAACRSHHNPQVRAVDVPVADLEAAARAVSQSIQSMAPTAEAFLRQVGIQLTGWQRHMMEQMYGAQSVMPRMMGRTARWLPGEVWAAAANWSVLPTERVEVAGYRPAADPDEPPTDPMARALWLRKRRNTGPQSDRLDGRRRQRR